MNKTLENLNKQFKKWTEKYHHRLIVINIVLIVLFLLHSVGYFSPFFPISINLIVLIGLFLLATLLEVGSNIFFYASIFFWFITLFFSVVQIQVWAERTGVYVFEVLLIGVLLFVYEQIFKVNK